MADPQTPAWLRPIIITSTVAVVLIGGFSAAKKLAAFADDLAPSDTNASEVVPGLVVDFVVAPGSVARDIAAQLAAAGVIADADQFEAAVEDVGAASSLKAGAYELVSGMELDEIISVLARGPAAESYRVTIPEGLRLDEILTLLAAETPHTREELEGALTDGLTSSLLPEGATTIEAWEGLLFPDTYEFAADGSARAVMLKLAETMELRVESVDWTKLEALGLTRYDAIIVASIIESEAKLDIDRPKIASVIYNRLDIDMRLQIDATVLYAMGKRGIGLSLSDLDIESPYNTYLIDGLPPGPIGAPRLASLQAAADPLASDFLFYVLTNVDGTHSFTASYDEFLVFKNQAKDDGVIP
jgi:UPF0755 protein